MSNTDVIGAIVDSIVLKQRSEMINALLASIIDVSVDANNEVTSVTFRVGDTQLTLDKHDVTAQSEAGTLRLSELLKMGQFVAFLKEQRAGRLPGYLQ